ncbi:MAG: tetratricopeptide repeat protein [Deltaproteobacteria bacterium]|nr:tetratricopeptide repeat protein [Deltaproteobacteria bacterium]MBW1957787.1 tetratricopeptide repeat protein [Deltaproteobacteria bacterium]MBW2013836.1 tetratricopeptide repeat protein [Deltaproteobacteria bacterium]MBW2087373.1 tetratricopeptide repeat protein [Deltaproteobacteria bacterium]MBW2320770.1 tetratricopeptide repeat protein [Deltaproteobacteria bacterium]
MRKFCLCVFILVLSAIIGFAITACDKTKEAYIKQGVANVKLKKYNQAIEDFSRAIKLDPNNAEYYYKRGVTYGNLNQHQKAIEDFNEAIRLNPKYAEAYSNRGFVYMMKLDDKKKACSDWKRACELGDCINLNLAIKKGVCKGSER